MKNAVQKSRSTELSGGKFFKYLGNRFKMEKGPFMGVRAIKYWQDRRGGRGEGGCQHGIYIPRNLYSYEFNRDLLFFVWAEDEVWI